VAITNLTYWAGSEGNRKKLITSVKTPSQQQTACSASQMITRLLFSWWEHTKLQSSTFREHVSFWAGFKEKVNVVATRPLSRFYFKHYTNIKQAQKEAMSGNYFCVTCLNFRFQ
jgi:hypothetical protein